MRLAELLRLLKVVEENYGLDEFEIGMEYNQDTVETNIGTMAVDELIDSIKTELSYCD